MLAPTFVGTVSLRGGQYRSVKTVIATRGVAQRSRTPAPCLVLKPNFAFGGCGSLRIARARARAFYQAQTVDTCPPFLAVIPQIPMLRALVIAERILVDR